MPDEIRRRMHLCQSGATRTRKAAHRHHTQSAPRTGDALRIASMTLVLAAALGQLAGMLPAQAAERRNGLYLEQAIGAGPHWIQAVAWSPDGKDLATASALPETQIWSANDLRLLRTLRQGARAFTATARNDVAYNSDGSLLAAGYGVARLWATSTWRPKISMVAPIAIAPRRYGVQSLLFNHDASRLIVAYSALPGEKTPPIVAYDTDNGSTIWTYELQSTIGGNPVIATGLYSLGTSGDVAFGTFESIRGPDWNVRRASRIVILRMDTGSVVRAIDNVQVDRITAMSVTRDGRWIATGTSTGVISHSYNVVTKKGTVFDNRDPARIWDARSGALIEQLPVRSGVDALAFSPDGQYLFEVEAKSPEQELLNVWNLATHSVAQSQLTPTMDREIFALEVSPGGKRVAAVGTGIAVYGYARGGH